MQELRNVRLGAREVEVRLSAGAVAALTRQNEELYIEMELYFSCLVGKRVNFLPAARAGSVDPARLNDTVSLGFRAVMTRTCQVGDTDHQLESESFLTDRGNRYVPRWFSLDYRNGAWSGEFSVK